MSIYPKAPLVHHLRRRPRPAPLRVPGRKQRTLTLGGLTSRHRRIGRSLSSCSPPLRKCRGALRHPSLPSLACGFRMRAKGRAKGQAMRPGFPIGRPKILTGSVSSLGSPRRRPRCLSSPLLQPGSPRRALPQPKRRRSEPPPRRSELVIRRCNTLGYTDTEADPRLELDLVVAIGGQPSAPVRSILSGGGRSGWRTRD